MQDTVISRAYAPIAVQKRARRRSTTVPPIAMPMPADGHGTPQSLLSLRSGPLTDTCSFRLPLPMAHAVAARRRRARGRPTFTREEEGKMAHLLICLARHLTSFDDSYPSLTPAITGNRLSTIIECRSSPFKLTSNDQIAQEGSENQNTGPLA